MPLVSCECTLICCFDHCSVFRYVDQLVADQAKDGIPADRVVVAGFSQVLLRMLHHTSAIILLRPYPY